MAKREATMRSRTAVLLFASLFAAAALIAVDAWRRHGGHDLARLAREAQADLRDALKAQRDVVTHYIYDPWPYGWGHAHYGWREDRHTFIYSQPPAPQPAPRPVRRPRPPFAMFP
ncbi:MAG: hypothetical protein AUJ52_01250 [Elusimicrobia bacterium CG1_02_63_36]|nr:MAG: hypothetical protein AUJ52_01250 [Elusimicrobia bacterium CG1_02_63_36]PIP82532.1 MAG: hypothetical protein COR54_14340 [Elusimicrobia bacterium CG22_combo_CG10-13_8_21_14_all_63_91]PJA14498.1 MAG: hypothetical protein COX66_12375 [Elusimicrobia bacterium CG_4_10_14_0_2_um_filter_63_34]PJB26355.1 MAG: hypothetical protein CO113_04080 [Elusimicrobia bacterium CG_4_9_14_3_um_filter_62_55]